MKSFTMQEHELFNTALALMKNLNRLSEANELMEKPVPNNLATEFKNRLETAITFPYNRNFNQETQLLHAEADRIVQMLKKQVRTIAEFGNSMAIASSKKCRRIFSKHSFASTVFACWSNNIVLYFSN